MTPAERELALQNLVESRERLLRMAHGLSREQLHYCPAPGRWSVAECLEHIVTVETRLLDRIHTTLEKGPDSSRRSVFEGQDAALVAGTIGRAQRLSAPEILLPTGRVADEQLLPEFEAARQRSREFAASTQADLRTHFFKHPIFGDLDLYQWLLMIAAHCDRHRAQSEEVIAGEGFPTAKKANTPA
ncbi:MAG: DinB family protein [Candidatus Acidiferrales bacterium]